MIQRVLLRPLAATTTKPLSQVPTRSTLVQPLSRRLYSIQSEQDALKRLPDIDPSKLTVTETTTPKKLLPPEELVFGRTFTGTQLNNYQASLFLTDG